MLRGLYIHIIQAFKVCLVCYQHIMLSERYDALRAIVVSFFVFVVVAGARCSAGAAPCQLSVSR